MEKKVFKLDVETQDGEKKVSRFKDKVVDLIDKEDKARISMRKYNDTISSLYQFLTIQQNQVIKNFSETTTGFYQLSNIMIELEKLNEKSAAKNNTDKKRSIEDIKKEIEALKTLLTTTNEINEDLKIQAETKKKLSQRSIDDINLEYDERIKKAKAANEKTIDLEKERKEKISEINKKLKEDLIADIDDQENQRNKILETSQEVFRNLYAEKEEVIRAQSQTAILEIEKEYKEKLEKAKENSKDITELEKEKQKKITDINNELNKSLKANAEDAQNTAKQLSETLLTSIINGADKVVKHTEGWRKGIIDVEKTKENVAVAIAGIDKYIEALKAKRKAEEEEYEKSMNNAKGNSEQEKKITSERIQAEKLLTDEIKKAEETRKTIEKVGQTARLEQMEAYANKFNDLSIKTQEYFSSGFGAIMKVYKAEQDSIDEDIKVITSKITEATTKEFDQKETVKEYEAQLTEARKGNDLDLIASLEARVTKEKELETDLINNKTKLTHENEKLKNEKDKIAVESEKIDKLNRKASLIKDIGEATSNIAKGITKAYSYGPFLGTVLAAVIGTAGAYQIGIMTKQLAKFENGGLLRGKRHSGGGMRIEGTNIEVEGGEYVVNRESTNKNLGLIRYINSQRKVLKADDVHSYFNKPAKGYEVPFSRKFESGGELPTINNTVNVDNEALVEAIRSIKFSPKVAVTDIIRAQDEMARVDGWTGM